MTPQRISLLVIAAVWVLFQASLIAAAPSNADIDDRTREIATELRCVVCQNLSVADSPSEMAQQMRAIVREHSVGFFQHREQRRPRQVLQHVQ